MIQKYTVKCCLTSPKIITIFAESKEEAEKKVNELLDTFTNVVEYTINEIK